MKQIILGTAGHIDHGKTSLIKKITGIDTDRLKEEKLRGITIELGFASMDLPSGQHLGIVDVPGHEKFVKNMVAGATGIDIVAMVIAADEGVMPQTREHMEICTLLGIKYGLVVLTKVDLVDDEWLELVKEDINDFLQGTFLENSPIIPFSSVTGYGGRELIETLDSLSALIPKRLATGLFRLPVDRVFSMKGFGTVITGTLISGHVQTGDTIMIYPSLVTSKVRGIQVHNKSVSRAEIGMRTAINFQGLEKACVNRGDVLAYPNDLKLSYMLDVLFNYLPGNKKPVKNRTRVRFHAGTSEVPGILVLLEKDELSPGETGLIQLRLDSPVTIIRDDRFVIRSYSPVRTIGGGYVLNPVPDKHKRLRPEIIKKLNRLVDNSPEEIIACHIDEAGLQGVSFSDLRILTNMIDKDLRNDLSRLLSKKNVICADKDNQIYIHINSFERIRNEITGYIGNYHKTYPLKNGMPKEELKTKFTEIRGTKFFNYVLSRMSRNNEIVTEQDSVRLAEHSVSLKVDQVDIKKRIMEIYKKGGLTPPYFRDVIKTLDIADTQRVQDVLMLLVDEGLIVKTKDDLYFGKETVTELQNKLIDFLELNGEINTPRFKEMTGVSRKYLIPLIEYFDSVNLTIRIGDIRKLRR